MSDATNWAFGQQCPICQGEEIELILEIPRVPVFCNLLFADSTEAKGIQRGDIRLGYCKSCGHIFNLAFQPQLLKYDQSYENALDCSPQFQRYAELLATALVEKYNLYRKTIIEIGCGQGNFLRLLCEFGGNQGIGFDPSYVQSSSEIGNDGRIKIIQDYYSEKYMDIQADFICCRHVLEHLADPLEHLGKIRRSLADRIDIPVFFEVPNMGYTLKNLAIWDIIYEHYSYFTPNSLHRVFTDAGFDVSQLDDGYGGQFLRVEAYQGNGGAGYISDQIIDKSTLLKLVNDFSEKFNGKIEYWSQLLSEMKGSGQKVVVWGAGSKGVSFLNLLDTEGTIESVVDINPSKEGMYISGNGQRIVAPEYLMESQPQVVIVMNLIYTEEIHLALSGMGLDVEILTA